MEQRPQTAVPPRPALTFYVTGRQPLRPEAVLLAILIACGALYLIGHGLHQRGHARPDSGESTASRSAGSQSGSASTPEDDKDDDPSQVDTIVLGDAGDAPVPARKGQRISNVHATVIVHLPRFGQQVGLIPDTASGHLLYGWLAAFNQSSYSALEQALPNMESASSVAAQIWLRHQSGGYNLLSAREVQPGVLVFRLRDQTEGAEVLGTLQVRPNSNPPAIASFSLRGIPVQPTKTVETAKH
ncbi:MAG: hypothetical protein ACRYF4_03095 [Janthinobacterium lividum]